MSGDRLEGKVALVTGAAGGIGGAIARRFVAEGARVVANDISVAGLASLADELGDSVLTHVADVTDETAVTELVAAGVAHFGRLDVAVVNAGTGTAGLLVDLSLDEWKRVVDLCLTGAFLTLKHSARAMTGGGSIVMIASLNAIQPGRGMGAYCSAKAGVAMLTQVAALELGPQQIRCNAIGPGLIMTQLTEPLRAVPGVIEEYIENTPIGRSGTTDEMANVALFLASDESSFVNGAFLAADGGARTQRYPDVIAGVERVLAGPAPDAGAS